MANNNNNRSDFFSDRPPGTGRLGLLSDLVDKFAERIRARGSQDEIMQEAIAPVEVPPAEETPGLPDLEARINEVMKGFEEFIERTPEATSGIGIAKFKQPPGFDQRTFDKIGEFTDFLKGFKEGFKGAKPKAKRKKATKRIKDTGITIEHE